MYWLCFFFVVVYVWVLSVVYESVFRYILLFAFLAEKKRFGDCILRVCLGFCLIEVNIEGRWLLFSISA